METPDNGEAVDESENPLSPENIGIVHFIVLSRIYDVLFLQLQLSHPEEASKLYEAHSNGQLLGTPPDFTGEFLSD